MITCTRDRFTCIPPRPAGRISLFETFFFAGYFLFILRLSCLSGYMYLSNNNKVIFNYFIFFIDLMILYLMTHYFGTRGITLFFFSILAWVIFTFTNPHISLVTFDVTTVTYFRWPFDLLYLFTDVPPPTHTCSHSHLHTPPHFHPSPLPSPHARAPRVFSYMC